MLQHQPRVSIGLPVFNGQQYLAAAVDSLLNQTFCDFELIISDNASTDHTPEICQEFLRRDSRVRYHRQETNRGAPWNFNRVFQSARGQYFKWHAADDLCAPTLLERCVDTLDRDSTAVLCYPRTAVIDGAGNLLPNAPGSWCPLGSSGTPATELSTHRGLESPNPQDRVRGILLYTVWCYELFGLIRHEAMSRTGLHRSSSSGGKIFLTELALQGRLVEVPEVLFFNRRHAAQYTMLTSAKAQRQFDQPEAKSPRFVLPHQFRCTVEYARLHRAGSHISLATRAMLWCPD